jgi:hypothetical protein
MLEVLCIAEEVEERVKPGIVRIATQKVRTIARYVRKRRTMVSTEERTAIVRIIAVRTVP